MLPYKPAYSAGRPRGLAFPRSTDLEWSLYSLPVVARHSSEDTWGFAPKHPRNEYNPVGEGGFTLNGFPSPLSATFIAAGLINYMEVVGYKPVDGLRPIDVDKFTTQRPNRKWLLPTV